MICTRNNAPPASASKAPATWYIAHLTCALTGFLMNRKTKNTNIPILTPHTVSLFSQMQKSLF
jgi:hypothetical protein